ncbi:limbic system-associated membrane protein-like [Diprion similis]|uniref:limbic system-associated membrane protein-like n=1 Tax=Diprion similis TaxID=362088 RepID=UPI001EF8E89A|nr:limbic system-associated membrane protein-like [Diprion similis]
MRNIVQVAALFTLLLISRGGCRAEIGDESYYDDDEEVVNEPSSETNSKPAEILTKPLTLVVHVGDKVILPCNVSNSESTLIAWYKGDKVIYFGTIPYTKEPNRIKLKEDNSLVINYFDQSDESNQYKCSITSKNQTVTHSVRIYVPPTVHIPTGELIVRPGENIALKRPNLDVTLSCIANWEPKPEEIIWSYKGHTIFSDKLPEGGISNYTVRNVTLENMGYYQCLAGNKVKMIWVLLNHAPRIEVDHKRVHTAIGPESELKCVVYSHPEAEVVWLKNGVEVGKNKNKVVPINPLQTNYTLTFSRTTQDDLGNYTCHAKNKMGSANAIIELTGAPTEAMFDGIRYDDATPILKWVVNSHAPILDYKLNYRRQGNDTWITVTPKVTDETASTRYTLEYRLEGLDEGSYETVLYAQNQYGWSPSNSRIYKFKGYSSTTSSGETASVQFLMFSRLLILAASLHIYTTYL